MIKYLFNNLIFKIFIMEKNFSFNKPRPFSSTYRSKNYLNSNIKKEEKSITKLSKRQIEFITHRPVKGYQRFISLRESLIGENPYFKYIHFRKKDGIKPMERPSLYENFNGKNTLYKQNTFYNTKKNKEIKWALGTTKKAPNENILPKKQQFKTYYFPPKYNNKEPEIYKNNFIKTDCIAIKTPKINKVPSEKSFLKMKEGYSATNETKEEYKWVPFSGPKSNINASSKNYNIINFKPLSSNIHSNCRLLNSAINNRKKGIGEFYELTNFSQPNFNKEYLNKLEENPKRFFKYNGIFTNMYDSSVRNGKINLPFNLKNM